MNLLDLSSLSLGPADGLHHPGISSFANGKWIHGLEALQYCRLDPQSTVLDVWEDLSLDPVTPSGGMRHRADLAVAQLKALQLDRNTEWCAAVPMEWNRSVVQIFLGVAQECGITITGCFPRALVVADQALSMQNQGWVLEWGWRHLSVGRVGCDEGVWQVSTCERISDAGVTPAFRRESKLAAAWMLDQHRVDPLHSGASEQELFNSWWQWHSGQSSNWEGQVGSATYTLSESLSGLQEQHAPLVEKQGVKNNASVVAPAAFIHLSGFTHCREEPPLRMPELDRLQLKEGKGPRWRTTLRAKGAAPEVKRPVTHVVVKGIAEPVTTDIDAEPGEQVTLQDGRRGMVIYVPES